MLVHRIYCCSAFDLAKDGMPVTSSKITYWDVMGASNGLDAILTFQDEAGQLEYLAWELVDEEFQFDPTYAWKYVQQSLGNRTALTSKVPRPQICPEVWYDGKTDPNKAMKAIRDLCKGSGQC